jgi:hypothetical protein
MGTRGRWKIGILANGTRMDCSRIVALNAQMGLPCPAFAGSLAYFDMYRRAELPGASLVQAQRDYFGSHTYERKDKVPLPPRACTSTARKQNPTSTQKVGWQIRRFGSIITLSILTKL